MQKLLIAALIAAALPALASAQTRCSAFGGVTTCNDQNGNSARASTFGGVTTTQGSDGSTRRCSTFAGVTTCN